MKKPLTAFACALGAAALPWLGAGCAHMEPPPGGPADSTRPFLIAVYPQPGATNAPRDLKAKLGFSEWINPDVERGGKIYLSPTPPRKLKTRLSGDVLEVTCASPLDSGTTYVLGALGNIRDLNGWPLEAPFQLVFSTGAVLDSAKLSGRLSVFPGARPPAGTFAALYPQGRELRSRFAHLIPDSGSIDSLPDPAKERPTYLAAPDSLGRFSFVGVKPGRYLALGFQDNNGNLVPNLGPENLAIGPSLVAPSAAPTGLALAPYDTVPTRLLDAHWAGERVTAGKSEGTVRLKFSRPLHPTKSLRADAYAVKTKGGASIPVLGVSVNPTTAEIELQTAPLSVDSAFIAACPGLRDALGNALDTARREAPFKVDDKLDTTPQIPVFLGQRRISGQRDKLVTDHFVPSRGLVAYYPRILFDSVLEDLRKRIDVKLDTAHPAYALTRLGPHEFSLRFAGNPFGKHMLITMRLKDTAATAMTAPGGPVGPGTAPAGKLGGPTGGAPATGPGGGATMKPAVPAVPAAGAPATPALPGIPPAGVTGAAAPGPAKPGDTTRIAAKTPPSTTLAAFNLDDSASLGSLTFKQEASARGARLVLRSLSSGLEYAKSTPQDAQAKLDSLPAGWYSADLFRDTDADGMWSPGRLKPWTPQEPFAHWADSVEVKAGASSDAGASARPAPLGDLSLP